MRCQRSARSAQRAGSSRPISLAWKARAVARLASGSPMPRPASLLARATAASASARIRPARSRDAATSPIRRFSSASPTIADSTSSAAAAMRATSTQSSVPLRRAHPRSAPRRASARAPLHIAYEAGAWDAGVANWMSPPGSSSTRIRPSSRPASSPASDSISTITRLRIALTNGTPAGLQSRARRLSSRASFQRPTSTRIPATFPASRFPYTASRSSDRTSRIPSNVTSTASFGRPSSSRITAWFAMARHHSSMSPAARALRAPEQLGDPGLVRDGPPPPLDGPRRTRPLDGLVEERQGRLGIVAPATDDGEGGDRVDRLGLRVVAHGRGDGEGLAGSSLRVPEGAGDHPLLREQREDPGPFDRRLRGGHVGGASERRRRPRGIAGGHPVLPEPRLEDRVAQPVGARTEAGQRALRVRDRAGGSGRRERGLRGKLGQVDRGRAVELAAGVVVPQQVARRRGQVKAPLEHGERVLRRLDVDRKAARLDRGRPRLTEPVRPPPQRRGDGGGSGERDGEGRLVARSLGRQQIGHDGSRDQLVADRQTIRWFSADEAVLDGLV